MESLAERLKSLFEQELDDGQTELETLANDHVCGQVISEDFKEKDYEQRRKLIRNVLDKSGLTAAELLNVGTLLSYTPDEWSAAVD